MESEGFELSWKDNISSAINGLRQDEDSMDIILACKDYQVEAHKFLLSAFSPFFRDLIRKNRHPHPLVYLKDVDYKQLHALVGFMYTGQVIIEPDEVDSFLALANELQVISASKAVYEKKNSREVNYTESNDSCLLKSSELSIHNSDILKDLILDPQLDLGEIQNLIIQVNGEELGDTENPDVYKMQESADNLEGEIEEDHHRSTIKDNDNSILFECPFCSNKYKSKDTLRVHKGRKHADILANIKHKIDTNEDEVRHHCLCGKRFKSASGVRTCRGKHKEESAPSETVPRKTKKKTAPENHPLEDV